MRVKPVGHWNTMEVTARGTTLAFGSMVRSLVSSMIADRRRAESAWKGKGIGLNSAT